MALNVKFLTGTQSKLDSITSGNYQAGAFYLTSDTDRLYFAQSATELVYLNKYIKTVPTQAQLPDIAEASVGDFYFVSAANALVTKNNNQWTQINPPDTNTDTSLTGANFAAVPKDGNIEVSYTLTQSTIDKVNGGDATPATPITGKFIISGSDIGSVVTNVALDVNASIASNTATVTLAGTGVASDATGFSITGGSNIQITGTDNAITVTASDTTYEMSSPANSTAIQLKETPGGDTDIVTISADNTTNSSVSVTGTDENSIVIKHKDYNYSKVALADQTPANASSFDIVSGVSLENGHVTGVSTSKVTLPNMLHKISSINAGNDGKIYVKLVDSSGDDIPGSINASDQVLYYKVDGAKVYNQAELTDYFYTKEDIDSTLKSANAMTFKGSVGETSDTNQTLPTTNVQSGDTYIVVGDTPVLGSGNAGKNGDLFIAAGTEGENGYLAEITWIYVPSGNEIDTTYRFEFNSTDGLKITPSTGGDPITLAITTTTDDILSVTTDGSLKIDHKKQTASNTEKESNLTDAGSFAVVTGVNIDGYGHVKGTEKTTFKLPTQETYKLSHRDANTVELQDSSADPVGSIKINGGASNLIEVTGTDNNAGTDFTVEHAAGSYNNTTTDGGSVILAPSNASSGNKTFTVVTGITEDGYGHIQTVTTKTYTTPSDSTYQYDGTVATTDNSATVTTNLKDSGGDPVGSAAFSLTSNNLTISSSGTTITADLQWGSF